MRLDARNVNTLLMNLPYETSNSNLSLYPQFFPLETLERVLIARFSFCLFLNVSEMFPSTKSLESQLLSRDQLSALVERLMAKCGLGEGFRTRVV